MKKIFSILLICAFIGVNAGFCEESLNTAQQIYTKETQEPQNTRMKHDDAPIWAEYVAPKYRNPRSDFSKGASISELVTGIVLTELLITAPIGIPMVVHGTTKVKMVSYNNRKNIFDKEIQKAQYIEDDKERSEVYQNILKQCHLKESTRQHYLKKSAKQAKKDAKKKAKKEKTKN